MDRHNVTLSVRTGAHNELKDITTRIQLEIDNSGVKDGMCLVYIPHTTAAVTINENADPSVKSDILMALEKIVPDSLPYRHAEGNSPGHVKASLMGSSVTVPVSNGRLVLGTWQGIFLAEFDGPRSRSVYLYIW
ncbi:MAG: secondary thiamine-phosphate synthase enzyme YjbQ [Candidatus Auribacterota bacterium]|jgi:secondary thiamine-phosphate synthase enzyme|nr:secondary thiamine-phosphate synthase enzyme YjbQ [Candidatus Auribacterota bacterium]